MNNQLTNKTLGPVARHQQNEIYNFIYEHLNAKLEWEYKRRHGRKATSTQYCDSTNMKLQSLDIPDISVLLKQIPSLNSESGQYSLKLIEDVSVLVFQIIYAEHVSEYTVAIMNFAKLRLNGPLLTSNLPKQLMTYFQSIFSKMDPQSGENFASLRDLLDSYSAVKESPLFRKLYRFCMYCLSLSLFDRVGITFNTMQYNRIEAEAIKSKYHMGPDFVHSMLDTILFLCERGAQCISSGTMDPLFHSESNYEEWFQKAQEIKRSALFMSNPEPHGLTRFEFLKDLDEAIEKGDAIYKHVYKLGNYEKKLVNALLNDLKLIKCNETTKRAAQRSREAPFPMLLFGGSSVGKCTLAHIMFCHYGKLFKLPTTSDYKYSRNFADPFYSGFNSSQWAFIFDDIAFQKPDAANGIDPSLMEVIQVMNNMPYVPNQAELADKGRTPLNCKLAIATTNTDHLYAHSYFACPLAIQRRFPFVIDVIPKQEYAKECCMLDSSKIPELNPGCYPDYWIFTIKRVVPVGEERVGQRGTLEDVQMFSNIYEFLSWFSKEALNHDKIQKQMSECNKRIENTLSLCKDCYIPLDHCVCRDVEYVLQSNDPDTDSSSDTVDMNDIFDVGLTYHSCETYAEYMDRITLTYPTRSIAQGVLGLNEDNTPCVYSTCENHPEYVRRMAAEEMAWTIDIEFRIAHLMYCYILTKCRSWISFLFVSFINVTVYLILEYRMFRACATWFYTFPITRRVFNLLTYATIKQSSLAILMLRLAGRRVNRTLKRHPLLQAVAHNVVMVMSSLVAVHLIFSFIGLFTSKKKSKNSSKHTPKPQSNEEDLIQVVDSGRKPEPLNDEKVNVWYKETYQTTNFDVTPMSTSYKGFSFESVQDVILRNCVTFRSEYNRILEDGSNFTSFRQTRAICVSGHVYMVNNHALPTSGNFNLEIVSSAHIDGVTPNIKVLVSQTSIIRDTSRDLAFVELRNLPPRKTIIDLFAKPTLSGGFKGLYLSRTYDGNTHRKMIHNIQRVDKFKSEIGEIDSWFGKTQDPTVNGDCGSVLLVDSSFGPIILGIHYLGSEVLGNVASINISGELIRKMISSFGMQVQSGVPLISAPNARRNIIELHPKSTVRYVPNGVANVYGSFAGFRPKQSSSVEATLIRESMLKRGYKIKCGKPVMDSWKPWNLAIEDMTKPVTRIDTGILKECVNNFAMDILKGLTEVDLASVHVYDNVTAINGAPAVAYIDKINRHTSAGCPWKKSKKFFMRAIPPIGDLQDPVEVDKEIMDRVNLCIDGYKKGVRFMPVFCGNLKDEATKFKKIEAGKTRVFTGAPFDWTIVVRKYLLSVIRLIQNKRTLFESAPGTIAQSLEWEKIRDYLVQHGEHKMIAGDFAKFDKSMSSVMILAAFDIISTVCVAAGYTEEEQMIVKGIAADTAFPLIDFNGDLCEFFGSNPSGHPLTVIINGLANSLYMRYCYAKLSPSKNCERFKQDVALMVYGDDNTMGVSDTAPFFTHTSIKKVLSDVGIDYTMADKESISIPYIHINDVSFLKRTWVHNEDVGAYLCPLDHESIEKMLTTCVKSKTITMEEQAIEVIGTAVREYFFYGKQVFEKRRNMLQEVVIENDLTLYVKEATFPTFDSLKKDFWVNSRHVTIL